MATDISATAATLFCRSSEVAIRVTHSALEFLYQPSVLIIYQGSFDQAVFPHVGCRRPQLDFFVTAENRSCINLKRIYPAVDFCICQPDGSDKLKPADVDLIFAKKHLNFFIPLFSNVEVFLDGKLISSSNNIYHHLPFIKTELTTNNDSNFTLAPCRDYRFRTNANSSQEVKEKTLADYEKGDHFYLELYGAPHKNSLACERLLLPGVTRHLRFRRSPSNCALENVGTWSAADDKKVDQTPYSLVIEKASLFVNKVVLSDSFKISLAATLTKSLPVYPYIESLNKSFIIQAGQNCFVKENNFGTEPVRRITVCMVRKFFRELTFGKTPFQ